MDFARTKGSREMIREGCFEDKGHKANAMRCRAGYEGMGRKERDTREEAWGPAKQAGSNLWGFEGKTKARERKEQDAQGMREQVAIVLRRLTICRLITNDV